MNKICVLGSINMDMVMTVDSLPRPGETVLARELNYYPGGKGANQAVAAKRIGSELTMLGSVGRDKEGDEMLESLRLEGIVTEHIKRGESGTGQALINVDASGNNSIVVLPASNKELDLDYLEEHRSIIRYSDLLICQLEIPLKVVEEAFSIARGDGTTTILNPAPGMDLSDRLLALTDIIIPNEREAEILTGIYPETEEDIIKASKLLLYKGVKNVIITLGSKGAFFMNGDEYRFVEAYKVDAIDTTAAGDSFVGAFGASLKSLSFIDIYYAIKIATKAASVTVTKRGAQSSLPYLRDIKYK